MKPKVQAQRKFAQGAFVPPSPNIINTLINRRVNTGTANESRYFFRHNTSARRLLDSISFEGIHTHKPIVVLERLENQQQFVQTEYQDDPNDDLLVPSTRSEPSNIVRSLPSRRKATNQSSTACLCSTSKGEKKKVQLKRKRVKRKYPVKTIRHKTNKKKKSDMNLRSSRQEPTVDTDFSIDDDKPLMYYTKRGTKRNGKNQENQQAASTTNKEIPQSLPAASPNIASVAQTTPVVKIEPLKENDGFSVPEVPVQFQVPTTRAAVSQSGRPRPNATRTGVRTGSVPKYRTPSLWAGTYEMVPSWLAHNRRDMGGRKQLCKRFKRFRTGSGAHLRVMVHDCASHVSDSTNLSRAPSPKTYASHMDLPKSPPQNMEIPEMSKPRIMETFSMDDSCDASQLETVPQPLHESFDENEAQANVSSLYSSKGIANWMSNSQAAIAVPNNDTDCIQENFTEYSTDKYHSPQATANEVDDGAVAGPSNLYEQCDSPSPTPTPTPVQNRRSKRRTTSNTTPKNKTTLPTRRKKNTSTTQTSDRVKILEAPVFKPTEEEFKDPIAYLQKVMPEAAKFGICKIVAPPGFKPECKLADSIRFTATNQYIGRLYSRWGPVTREICALRSFLQSQNITFTHAPLMEGLEVNLPKLFKFLQRQGGLKAKLKSRTYLDTRKWGRLAEELRYPNVNISAKKLDQIYVKYLLPYDALTQKERQELAEKMDKRWSKRNDKLLQRARNPLHRQKRLLGESESSDEDDNEENQQITATLNDAEECVIRGRYMNLVNFRKIAKTAVKIFFPSKKKTADIESQYWKLVLLGNEHVCVNTASIDTGAEGHGFTKNKNEPYGKHPWNLKMMSQHTDNVLRLLGPVLGVTVPTLQFGMIYSTSCWHRDPHGLPWMEYMHTGPPKIWYGIPDTESTRFRRAVEYLCPTACQNKSIWLPSDITMIPPPLLLEQKVSMSRVVQKPGEYIVVLPKAYSSSICTGFTVSESVYFATSSWVKTVNHVFQELRESCEPTMFSLEQLLIALARDKDASLTMLQLVHENFSAILTEELENRRQLEKHGLKARPLQPERQNTAGAWNANDNECEVCRTTLYLSRVRGVFRKKSSVCLRHALQVLDNKDKKIERREDFEMEYFIKTTELKALISSVIQRLTTPLQQQEE